MGVGCGLVWLSPDIAAVVEGAGATGVLSAAHPTNRTLANANTAADREIFPSRAVKTVPSYFTKSRCGGRRSDRFLDAKPIALVGALGDD